VKTIHVLHSSWIPRLFRHNASRRFAPALTFENIRHFYFYYPLVKGLKYRSWQTGSFSSKTSRVTSFSSFHLHLSPGSDSAPPLPNHSSTEDSGRDTNGEVRGDGSRRQKRREKNRGSVDGGEKVVRRRKGWMEGLEERSKWKGETVWPCVRLMYLWRKRIVDTHTHTHTHTQCQAQCCRDHRSVTVLSWLIHYPPSLCLGEGLNAADSGRGGNQTVVVMRTHGGNPSTPLQWRRMLLRIHIGVWRRRLDRDCFGRDPGGKKIWKRNGSTCWVTGGIKKAPFWIHCGIKNPISRFVILEICF